MDLDKESGAKKFRNQNRKTIAKHMQRFEQLQRNCVSQREAANEVGIPRSTIRHWIQRKRNNLMPPIIVACFESAEGVGFLHRLVSAIQLVMTQVGGCGIRLVSLVLRLSHLDHFVACSYESLRQRGVMMEELINEFGGIEKERLAAKMTSKKIMVAQDETFHPQICLVAIDVVSNFILLEQYSNKRDAAAWNHAMDTALSGLPVEILQSTSDEASGLINHVQEHLGAHHSPDIFHVQQEVTKATSAPLASKTKSVEKSLAAIDKVLEAKKNESPLEKKRGRPCALSTQTKESLLEEKQQIAEVVKSCQQRQERVKKANVGISESYHPFDIETGARRTPQALQTTLEGHFDTIKSAAKNAGLKKSSHDRIAKAEKVCQKLVSTLTFFWVTVSQIIESLELPKALETMMYEKLIPAYYLLSASQKVARAEQRTEIREKGESFLSAVEDTSLWIQLDESEKTRLKKIAMECAHIFQRSSSCVEGRNGHLSLRHHGLHRLSDRKLTTLTVLHNYFIKRQDKTTAAERFFGEKPRNLFEYLLQRMPDLPRPAKKQEPLAQVA